MENELARRKEESVFKFVEFTGQPIIRTVWVFDYKPKEKRYSARLVARGDYQQPGQYHETFAPTMPVYVLRLLCIAINFRLLVWNVDMKRAFLNAKLIEAIFIRPPKMMGINGSTVIKLKLSLYGLKQSGHQWYQEILA